MGDADIARTWWEDFSTRSSSRTHAAATMARHVIRTAGQLIRHPRTTTSVSIPDLDLWIAITIILLCRAERYARSTVNNMTGAITALVERILPDETATTRWTRTEMAKRTSGIDAAGTAARGRTRRLEAMPSEVEKWLRELGEPDDLDEQDARGAAAMALASALSLPVTVTTHLRTNEIQLVKDEPKGTAVILGYAPRTGRKTATRLASGMQQPAADRVWVAATTPAVHRYFRPWFVIAQRKGDVHVFS